MGAECEGRKCETEERGRDGRWGREENYEEGFGESRARDL